MQNHTVAMIAATEYRRGNYGVLLESATDHRVTGRGVHNPSHDHVIEVWENRERDGVLIDPFGRPTADAHTVLMAAKATVIAARPATAQRATGDAIALGDTVTLTSNGFPIGTYIVSAGRMTDPVLVPAA